MAGDNLVGVDGDGQLFIGSHYGRGDTGAGHRDDGILARRAVVQLHIDVYPEPVHILQDGVAHEPGVLAYAASEHQQVAAVHLCRESTDILLATLGKDIEGMDAALVAVVSACPDVAHVLSSASKTHQSALFIQDVVCFLHTQVGLLHQIQQSPHIDVAATRPHGQPLERGHAHAVVHTLAVVYGADTGATA